MTFAKNLQKNSIIVIGKKFYKIVDIMNDKIGGSVHRNFHVQTVCINDNSPKKFRYYDNDDVCVAKIQRHADIVWVGIKDEHTAFALDKNGNELIVDLMYGVSEENVSFVSYNEYLVGIQEVKRTSF